MTNKVDSLIPLSEAARILDVSHTTVWRWVHEGRIAGEQGLGTGDRSSADRRNVWMVSAQSVERFAENRRRAERLLNGELEQ